MSELQVELVAADRRVWTGAAKFVRVRTVNGDLGVLPGHAPMLAVLLPGEVLIEPVEGGRQTATVEDGFLSVDSDKITIVSQSVDAPGSPRPLPERADPVPSILVTTEVLVAVLLLGTAIVLMITYTRRRRIAAGKALTVCGLRDGEHTQWRVGLMRMGEAELSWYSVGGLSTRPTHVWSRSGLEIDPPRAIEAEERLSVLPGAERIPSRYHGFAFDFALQPADYRGLRAWLESAPPSFNTDLTIS